LPNVPTFGETGIKEVKDYSGYRQWVSFIAAADIPQEASSVLQKALDQSLNTAKVKESFRTMGYPVVSSTPQQFATRLRLELESNKKLMASGAVKLQ
jgi:tripartite-type tricarboxylate transporter receptor subunit TctC